MKRLFIAALPSPEASQALVNLSTGLQKAAHFTPLQAKWIDFDQLFLTFQFIGSTPDEQFDSVLQTVEHVADQFEASAPELRTIGFFPNPKSPTTAWVGLANPNKALSKIAYELREQLKKIGLELPPHSFLPHITLARFSSLKGTGAFVGCVSSYQKRTFGEFPVDHLAVVESSLSQNGPTYSVIKRFPLKQSDNSS